MNVKFILTLLALSFIGIIYSQNVIIKGTVNNYSPNYVPFAVRNFKSNNNSVIPVKLFPNKSYETSIQIEKPSIYTLFYKTIFLEPNDTILFNFSFLTNDPKNYENSINVDSKYPGNLLYYDFLERLLINTPKLSRSDSVGIYQYYDTLRKYIYLDVKVKLDSFVQVNKISISFKKYIDKEFDFYFLSNLLRSLQYNTESFCKSIRLKIDDDINKSAINDPDLVYSLYHFFVLGSYVESYTRPQNVYLGSSDYYKNAIEKSDQIFIGVNKDLAFAACTRLHYISKPNILNEVSDSIKNHVLTHIEDLEIKQSLVKFLSSYIGINEASFQDIRLQNTKNQQVNFKQIIGENNPITIIDFWASWCIPCIKEYAFIPSLLSRKPNVKVISVSIDTDKTAWIKKVKDLNMRKQNQFVILNDIENDKLTNVINLSSIPRFMILNKNGKIIFSNASRPENLNELIKEIELTEGTNPIQ